MKKIQIFLLIFGFGLMMGCGKPVMPPLKYDEPIDFEVKKNAYLNWEFGKQYSGKVQSYDNCHNNSAGLIGVLLVSAISSIDHANNPSRYTVSYGKAEQAIFMTSLRDILRKNHVFKQVELITDLASLTKKDVLVNVFFKTARVTSLGGGQTITLSVEMIVTTNGKAPFKRTYLVKSDAQGFSPSFQDQQIDVSNRLLGKIIAGLQEWHNTINLRSK